ncbi:MAG: DUF559 domain-containing protein [Lutibacter sp.]|jgi:very-short-patch-repair endonuclease
MTGTNFNSKQFTCSKCNKSFNAGNFKRHKCNIYPEDKIKEVCELYFSGMPPRKIIEKGYRTSLVKFALHGKRRSKSEAMKVSHKYSPECHKHSQETKDKISKSRIEFIKEHPEKAPYKLNHSSRKSWPEEIFENALNRHNIKGWIRNYQNSIYEYDFAFPLKKIDVEVDGKTHNLPKVQEIDKRRDEWSKSQGWHIIRFKTSAVLKDIEQCIEYLKKCLSD